MNSIIAVCVCVRGKKSNMCLQVVSMIQPTIMLTLSLKAGGLFHPTYAFIEGLTQLIYSNHHCPFASCIH